jgi:MFS transporter, MHS family, citrate/tricarballylate:H+ symporter
MSAQKDREPISAVHSQAAAALRPVRLAPRAVLAVGVGNALEFYDFTTFAYFAIQIGHTFFPPETAHGLLYTLATFGVGFLTRPLGAILIGRYADRAGRTAAMVASFTLMGVGILGLALTPGYGRIGMAAPILLVSFRLLQGFAVGGEVGPSTAYLAECAPPERRGLYVALQLATQYAAGLASGIVGLVLAATLSDSQLQDFGWRIALLLGVAVVPAGLYIRRRLPETAHQAVADAAERRPGAVLLACCVLLAATCTTCVYVVDYMNTYVQDTLGVGVHFGFGATIVEGLSVMGMAPLGGILSDRFGRKPVMRRALATLILVVTPAYLAMAAWRSPAVIYVATVLLAGLEALMVTSVLTLIVESMPRAVRAAAFGLLYAGTVAVFGGFAQFIVRALIELTGNPLAPAGYLILVLIIGGAATLGVRETAPCARAPRAEPVLRHA